MGRGALSTPPSIDLGIHFFLTLNVFRRKHRDTSESFSVDGIVRISDINQSKRKGRIIAAGDSRIFWYIHV